ncbi:MAG: hypothetical protein ABII71_00325 [Candidatus Micrarchaeota archaeon]
MEEPKQAEVKTVSDALRSIQIALDNYDDIFSDFDPSPYQRRLLSDDFLKELYRRYAMTRKEEFIVNFTLPKKERSEKTEELIRKRLKDHFRGRLRKADKKAKELRKNGLLRLLAGFAISTLMLVFSGPELLPFITMVSVLAWYLLWSGYENFFEAAGKTSVRKAYYERFLGAKYNFSDEEDVLRQARVAHT